MQTPQTVSETVSGLYSGRGAHVSDNIKQKPITKGKNKTACIQGDRINRVKQLAQLIAANSHHRLAKLINLSE